MDSSGVTEVAVVPATSPLRRVAGAVRGALASASRRLGLAALFQGRRQSVRPPPTCGFGHSASNVASSPPSGVGATAKPAATMATPAVSAAATFSRTASASSSSASPVQPMILAAPSGSKTRKRRAKQRKGRCPWECDCGAKERLAALVARKQAKKNQRTACLPTCSVKIWSQQNKKQKKMKKSSKK